MENQNSEELRLYHSQKDCFYFLPQHEVAVLNFGLLWYFLSLTVLTHEFALQS